MRKTPPIPYEETTILSLPNMVIGTKFRLISRIEGITKNTIKITDGYEDLKFSISNNALYDLKEGEIIIIFGEKTENDFEIKKIVQSNLDWDLYCKTRDIESK